MRLTALLSWPAGLVNMGLTVTDRLNGHQTDFPIDAASVKTIIAARCTTMQSAVFLSLVVCLSVCLSVTLVDHDHHIGGKSWKLIARTISPTFRSSSPKDHPPTSRGTCRNFRESRCGVGKSGVLEHKDGNILKRVKIEEKLLWRAYRKSSMLFRFFWVAAIFLLPVRPPRRPFLQSVLDGTNGLSISKPCVYCRILWSRASRGNLCDITAFLFYSFHVIICRCHEVCNH